MGLYEKEFDFGFELSKARLKVLGLIVIFLVVVIALFFIASTFFQPKAIVASLSDNPLDLKEKHFTLLNVVVTNVTAETARNVQVKAEAEDKQAIVIGTAESHVEKIDLVESGLNRKIHFLVWPMDGIKEGNYRIKISTTFNGQAFEENVVLQVIPD